MLDFFLNNFTATYFKIKPRIIRFIPFPSNYNIMRFPFINKNQYNVAYYIWQFNQ